MCQSFTCHLLLHLPSDNLSTTLVIISRYNYYSYHFPPATPNKGEPRHNHDELQEEPIPKIIPLSKTTPHGLQGHSFFISELPILNHKKNRY